MKAIVQRKFLATHFSLSLVSKLCAEMLHGEYLHITVHGESFCVTLHPNRAGFYVALNDTPFVYFSVYSLCSFFDSCELSRMLKVMWKNRKDAHSQYVQSLIARHNMIVAELEAALIVKFDW